MMRIYLVLALAGTLLAGVYLYGEARFKDGKQALLADIEKARVASVERKKEIEDEINGLDDDELLRRALGWVRNPGR